MQRLPLSIRASESYFDKFRTTLYIGSFVVIQQSNVGFNVRHILFFDTDHNGASHVTVIVYDWFKCSAIARDVFPCTTTPLKDIPEVVESLTQRCFNCNKVYDIALVFNYIDVVKGKAFCSGIRNFFFIRYRMVAGNPTYLEINEVDAYKHYLYPTINPTFCCGTCYHNRIYQFIHSLQDVMIRLLNKTTQYQFNHQYHRETMFITKEQWNYTKDRCPDDVKQQPYDYDNYKVRTQIHNDLTTESYGLDVRKDILRFDTVSHLQVFTEIFGNTTVIGTRDSKPKKGQMNHPNEATILNYLLGNHTIYGNRRRSRHRYGVDLTATIFDYDVIKLIINVKYFKAYFNSRFVLTDALTQPTPTTLLNECYAHPDAVPSVASIAKPEEIPAKTLLKRNHDNAYERTDSSINNRTKYDNIKREVVFPYYGNGTSEQYQITDILAEGVFATRVHPLPKIVAVFTDLEQIADLCTPRFI